MNAIDRLHQDNARYLWHPMAHPQAMRKQPPDIIVKGEGCWIWDVHGQRLLDSVGGLWSSNLGHSNRVVRDAIVAQLDELPYYNVFRGTTHPRAIEISRRLVDLMAPDGVTAVAFSNGGSDAVESALKIARQYFKLKGQSDRTKFISLRQGYHGVHFGGMSVNGNSNFRRAYEPMLGGCIQVDTPWLYRNPFTDDPLELGRICAGILEREIIAQGPDTIAAFIAEPVQGAGGVIVPPPNYWPLVRDICDRHGVLLIADEVVTGFGRGGQMFGTRLWNVKADLWCLAKGITSGYVPMGATAITARVADAFYADTTGMAALAHGYTYSAHPVAAAAALAALDQVEALDLPANAARMGERLMAGLADFTQRFDLVGNVRGIGLMVGLEMVSDKANKTPFARNSEIPGLVGRAAYEAGLMVRISGANLILSPPLIINAEEVDFIVDALAKTFTKVQAERKA